MKLIINRSEKADFEEGALYYFSKADLSEVLSTGMKLFYLDVFLHLTPDERDLVEKLNWGGMPLCKGELPGVKRRIDFDVAEVVGRIKLAFDNIENLINVESQLVQNVNKLEEQLGDFSSRGMSEARRQLAVLYQRIIQDELGLSGVISEDGDILFEHPDLGELFISLNGDRDPEYMKLMLPAFFNATHGVSRLDLIQICNRLNGTAKLTSMIVSEDAESSVSVYVGLLLAPPDSMPTEFILRGVIGRAISSIKSAVEKFATEVDELSI